MNEENVMLVKTESLNLFYQTYSLNSPRRNEYGEMSETIGQKEMLVKNNILPFKSVRFFLDETTLITRSAVTVEYFYNVEVHDSLTSKLVLISKKVS